MPRLTVAQALVRFLAAQETERDGVRRRLINGCYGIFGHGNVAGLGQALQQYPDLLAFHPARNEQGMVHIAAGYARQQNRLSTLACTTSIGPGATNMVTGAAAATINRLPVLLLPGDTFATRTPHPVLQMLEVAHDATVSVNDCLRPVSKFYERVERPEQLIPAALGAVRVLTDPAETGAVTLALPEDVQTEAFEVPEDFLAPRTWTIYRQPPAPEALARAAEVIRAAKRPLIVAGGGVIYSEATAALRTFVDATGIPVAETMAGRGALVSEHPLSLGAIGATGGAAGNRLARDADLVIGIGTRWSDFTTASHSAFRDPDVRFVNVNVAAFDAGKHAALPLVADARVAVEQLTAALEGHRADAEWERRANSEAAAWNQEVARLVAGGAGSGDGSAPSQAEIIGAVNDAAAETGIVVNAAGSAPGDLHKLWHARDPAGKGYHVEYGYSCMGYEIPGGMGVKLAAPEREVYVLVGDGSYLMLPGELVTAVAEAVPIVIVLIDNHGYASIGALSRSIGSSGFGTHYRFSDNGSVPLDPASTEVLPIDLAANAESLGARVIRTSTIAQLREALARSRGADGPVVIHIEADRYRGVPSYESWWDVPVAEVSVQDGVRAAREEYQRAHDRQRQYLRSP
jgi:3D-(3,5/4)-trihydroxycyclohexane-1,2-dione acylhydrolase (decyclizing)